MMLARIVAPLRDTKDVNAALAAMTRLNRHYYRRNGSGGALLTSGVRYQREGLGQEVWQTLPVLLAAGIGDCEDLATAFAAEVGGTAFARRTRAGYHILVRLPSGRIFDPSLALGMRNG